MEALDADGTRGVEQRHGAEHVRTKEPRRVDDRKAVVRLGREVDYGVDLLVPQRALGEIEIADVAPHEHDPLLDVGQALAVPRIREQVVGDDVVVRIPAEPIVDEVGADEPRGSGHEEAHRARA